MLVKLKQTYKFTSPACEERERRKAITLDGMVS